MRDARCEMRDARVARAPSSSSSSWPRHYQSIPIPMGHGHRGWGWGPCTPHSPCAPSSCQQETEAKHAVGHCQIATDNGDGLSVFLAAASGRRRCAVVPLVPYLPGGTRGREAGAGLAWVRPPRAFLPLERLPGGASAPPQPRNPASS
jgi:hypothetical protein